ESHRREPAVLSDHVESGEQDVADHLSLLLGDQFQDGVAAGDQRVHQARFGGLPEGLLLDQPDRLAIPGLGAPYSHHAHASLSPLANLAPRMNSPAGTGLPPARCSSTSRTAPLPQAIVSASSRIS